jgi:hypothetical protein
MFQQSNAMSCATTAGGDRWTAAKTALQGFVQAPTSTGISVGIQYFGNTLVSSCTAADYERPNVEIAPLLPNAVPIVNSLNAHGPSTNTPLAAGLTGAINHAVKWKASHPADITAVVIVTTGVVNTCGTLMDAVTAATTGWANGTGVRTFVVGVGVGLTQGPTCGLDSNPPTQADLDKLAAGGGTQTAFLVGTTVSPFQQVADVLNQLP